MRFIKKGPEPPELTRYRKQPDAKYDGPLFTSVKDEIRKNLLKEQGHLCAYCMRRIDAVSMKVEHWLCQDHHPDLQLDYSNLLGVCPGNEGQPQDEQTCDTRKGNQILKYNPANPAHRIEDRIRYLGNGTIYADHEPDFDAQIDKILNLNRPRLKENREAVIDAVKKVLNQKPGTRTSAEIEKYLDTWTKSKSNGELREYCGVAVYFLKKRLRRLKNGAK